MRLKKKVSIVNSNVKRFFSLFPFSSHSPRETTLFESRSNTTALAPCVPTSRPTEKRGIVAKERELEKKKLEEEREWFFFFKFELK